MPVTHSLLLVDDEPAVLFTLQMVFQNAEYLVTVAAGTSEALKLMQPPNRYDGVITDLRKETEHSGFEIAEAAARLTPRPVIVILTGYASDEKADAAMSSAVDHIEFKPFDLDEFKDVLRGLLVGRRDRLQQR